MSARSLVAAAARWTRRLRDQSQQQTGGGWQHRAWAYWDQVPEMRYGARWIGNAMSKARLVAGVRGPDGTIDPLPDTHRAAELVATIGGGPAGQAEMLKAFGPHLVVAGEGWIVIRPGEGDVPDWRVLSVLEISQSGRGLEAELDGVRVEIPPHDPAAPDPLAPAAIRVWEPHPRRQIEADSPIRSSLDLLEELRLLGAAVAAIARSRLTGRGVLLIPQGVRFPTSGQPGSEGEDDLIDVFMQVAETAYREPESAAATVPIILEVPAEAIGDIKLLTFESVFDEIAIKLREEVIRRLANGLDVPAEILLGQGDINHWGVWSLKEEAITLAVEPRLATVADALTSQWLRPLLEDEGHQDADRVLVWYDSSSLRIRANRAQTALEVYDRGAISAEALRRETGFEETDAPAPGEAARVRAPRQVELPVDESEAIPDTLPASALVATPAERMDRRGREITEVLKRKHGLDDDQLADLLRAMVLMRDGGGDG